ncbi:MAG: GntR family transcriptional regulator [Pseudonocardia sp.]|nr:GntR family transcriptional regulator [Pseudonocardia sp.]
MKGLRTVSVVDALVSSLRDRVLNGEIPAGAGVTETDVATAYEVSRPTARIAITALVQDGLLRREAHRPARVPELTRADVEDLFLARVPLELEVVRSLAEDGEVPVAAKRAIDDLAAVGPDTPHSVFVEADLRFHRELVVALGSPRLTRLYQVIAGEIHLSMVQSRLALGRDRIVAEHAAIFDALTRPSADLAVDLMRAHLQGARAAMAERLDDVRRSG